RARVVFIFFFSSRRRHTRWPRDWSSDVCSSDLLLRSAVRLRLQADVPVGGYLSGGIDSSIVCALATADSPHALRTFSVTFEDPALDESAYQREIGRAHV